MRKMPEFKFKLILKFLNSQKKKPIQEFHPQPHPLKQLPPALKEASLAKSVFHVRLKLCICITCTSRPIQLFTLPIK